MPELDLAAPKDMLAMSEAEMGEPVMNYFRSMGYEVWCEIPFYQRVVDIVAMKEDMLVAIELKRSFTRGVMLQAVQCQLFSHQTYCCAYTKPSSNTILAASKRGLGLLRVVDGECMKILDPNNEHVLDHHSHNMRKRLRFIDPGGEAGHPCRKGVGPAQEVSRLVEQYRKNNSDATWDELYSELPNHYCSARSMRGALVSRGMADA